MAARSNVLAVQVERDRAELDRLRAVADARASKTNLTRLLGLTPRTDVDPAEPLARAGSTPTELEALIARALTDRPERAALAARVDATRTQVRAEQASYYPQVLAT